MLKNAENQAPFLDSVMASFEKTFIRENRWMLFAEGIGTTMMITVLSILFSTALGFLAAGSSFGQIRNAAAKRAFSKG